MTSSQLRIKIYYLLKSFLPRRFQIWSRRILAGHKRKKSNAIWPILPDAGQKPENWVGWPNDKQFAIVLTHDVETHAGQNNCLRIAQIEKELGFRSLFNFVPKRYQVSGTLRAQLTSAGFEIGVHGLYHDGKLFQTHSMFFQRAILINKYLKEWRASGFRAPSMHHNLNWIHELNIKYDMSTFDTDPFEPQPDGVGTIFPFWVKLEKNGHKYLELPYTLPQDFTLFILLKEYDIRIWKEKLNWIADRGGMALLNIHPDYLYFHHEKCKALTYPVEFYLEFLHYVSSNYKGQYWNALPIDIVNYYEDISATT